MTIRIINYNLFCFFLHINHSPFISETILSTYTGTTAPNTYTTKTAVNYFTGTTLPANYYNKTQINSYTGTTSTAINNRLLTSTFSTYTDTTLPANYYNKTQINSYTGTTAPAAYASKTFLNTYTGTTAPAAFASKTFLSTYTGTTAPNTYATKTAVNYFTGTTLPTNYYNKTQINSYTGTTAPNQFASKSFLSTYTGTTAPNKYTTWTGSTVNGVGTYVSANKICSQPNLTFNGTQLYITGNVYATTSVKSPIISGTTIYGVTNIVSLAGDAIIAQSLTERTSTFSIAPVSLKDIKMNAYSGTYRIKFDVKYATGTGGNTAQVYRNGVAKGTLRTPTTTYVTYCEQRRNYPKINCSRSHFGDQWTR